MFINIFNVFASLCIVSCVDNSFKYAYAQSIPYIVEIWDEPMSNNSFDSNVNEVQNLPSNCAEALENFTEKITNLTRCVLLNARPIRICTNCEKEINASEDAYTKLTEEPPDCKKSYFESDQVGIINLVYGQGRSLWSRNNCQNCYNNVNDTQEFFKVSRDLDLCMQRYNQTSEGGLNDTCSMCQEFFVEMIDIYKNFVKAVSSDEGGGVCMDIVDQMNITRHIWSSKQCLKFDSSIGYPNLITALLVAVIPVLFYTLSKNVSNIEAVKLVRPKRKSYASLQESLANE